VVQAVDAILDLSLANRRDGTAKVAKNSVVERHDWPTEDAA